MPGQTAGMGRAQEEGGPGARMGHGAGGLSSGPDGVQLVWERRAGC